MNTRINLNLQSDLSLTNATFSEPTISSPTGLVQGDISGITSSLASLVSKDTSIDLRISTENSTRTSADISLTTRISIEESARSSADTSLTTRVSTEESLRSSEDTSFINSINNFSTSTYQYITFSGLVNDINTVYTNTTNDLSSASFTQVYLNGLLQDISDYTANFGSTNSTITFSDAPETGSKIKVLVYWVPKLSVSSLLLLDIYPTTGLAYSLRKLKYSYTGSAIRIRRSSDNAETDIGFVGSNLDTDAITNFVGANSAFVTKWYDQSGLGQHATQITASQQPRIVNTGTIETNAKGKVAVRFIDSTNSIVHHMKMPVWHSASQAWVGVFSTYQMNGNGFYPFLQAGSPDGRGFQLLHNAQLRSVITETKRSSSSSYTGSALSLNQLYLRFDYVNRSRVKTFLNGSSSATIDGADSNTNFNMPTNYFLGNQDSGPGAVDFSISEFIAYITDQVSNKTGIEANIKNYYDI